MTPELIVCILVVAILATTTIFLAFLAKSSNVAHGGLTNIWQKYIRAWREGRTAAERFLLILLIAGTFWRGGSWGGVALMAGATGTIGAAVCAWEVSEILDGIRGILCDAYGAVRGTAVRIPCGPLP